MDVSAVKGKGEVYGEVGFANPALSARYGRGLWAFHLEIRQLSCSASLPTRLAWMTLSSISESGSINPFTRCDVEAR